MRYHDLYDDFDHYFPASAHPAKRERSKDIASLYVHKPELDDLNAIRRQHGATEVVSIKSVPMTRGMTVDVLCRDSHTASALMDAWATYCETSPHRPHSLEEAIEWGKHFKPYEDIPPEWRF